MRDLELASDDRILGELIPTWLGLVLALLGTLGSVATAWMLFAPDSQMAPSVLRTEKPVGQDTTVSALSSAMSRARELTETSGDKRPEDARVREEEETAVGNGMQGDKPSPPSLVGSIGTEPELMPADDVIKEPSGSAIAQALGEGGDGSSPPAPSGTRVIAEPVQLPRDKRTEEAHALGDQLSAPAADDCPPLFGFTFDRGSAEPKAMGLAEKVAQLREWLLLHPEVTIRIEGHTDSWGEAAFNIWLSDQRAKAVATLLTEAGIQSNQLTTLAYGEKRPLEGFSPRAGTNRRVTMGVEGGPTCLETISDEGKR